MILPPSASWVVAGTTDTCHYSQVNATIRKDSKLFFKKLVHMEEEGNGFIPIYKDGKLFNFIYPENAV